MSARVWLLGHGVVLAHRAEGFPMPPLDHDARAKLGVSRWPWRRGDVWPCSGVDQATDDEPWRPFRYCRRLAVWRVGDGATRGHYCGQHVYVQPAGDPVELCAVCTGPLDPVLTAYGETTHPTCAPDANDVTWDDALALLATITEETA